MIRTTVVDAYGGSIRLTYVDGKIATLTILNDTLRDVYELEPYALQEFLDAFEFVRRNKKYSSWDGKVTITPLLNGEHLLEGNTCSVYLSDEMFDALIDNLNNIKFWYEFHEVI